MASNQDIIDELRKIGTTTIVACPVEPAIIQGSISSGAYTANDAMGLITKVKVPKRGVLLSATFCDLDDEGKQVDLEIFNHPITQVASEAAWTLSAANNPNFIDEINFVAFDDHDATQTSKVRNIGTAYVAPEGYFYIQAVNKGTPTIGVEPRFQLQIQSFDPEFKES